MTVVSHRGSAAVLALTTILSTASSERLPAAPLPDKLDAALQRLLEHPVNGVSRARVILSAKPGRLPSLLLSLRPGGYSILNEHATIEAVTVELPPPAIAALSAISLVESVSLDAPTRALATAVAPTPGDRAVWGDSTFDQDSVSCGSVSTSPSTPANPLATPQP